MKDIITQLNKLKHQTVSVFCETLSGAHCMIEGVLIGADLPGQPYGVANFNIDQSRSTANMSFKPENVREIQIRTNQNIISLK